jgi:hypothetical protein
LNQESIVPKDLWAKARRKDIGKGIGLTKYGHDPSNLLRRVERAKAKQKARCARGRRGKK